MDEWDNLDDRKKKKIFRALRNAGYAVGGGAGLLVIKFIFPEGNDLPIRPLFDGIGLWLIIYAALVILTFLFKRLWTARINALLFYWVTPAVIIRLMMDSLNH